MDEPDPSIQPHAAGAFEQAYEELLGLARAHFRVQPASHTLQPTALVNEVFMKMSKSASPPPVSQQHMLAIASQAMRQVLVDHARRKKTQKRTPGDGVRLTLTDVDSGDSEWDILELNDAMERLNELQPRQAEIVELRFFGGMSVEQVAEILDVSERTIYLDWQMAKAWLWAELRQGKR